MLSGEAQSDLGSALWLNALTAVPTVNVSAVSSAARGCGWPLSPSTIAPRQHASEVLEIIRNTDERYRVASKSAFIQFKKHISRNHQPANQPVLETKRTLGDVNVRSSLRDVRMCRPWRIRPARGAGRICRAGAVS